MPLNKETKPNQINILSYKNNYGNSISTDNLLNLELLGCDTLMLCR